MGPFFLGGYRMTEQSGGDGVHCPLTVEQRALVEANLGLVALHIRRNVRNLGAPRSYRDFEDLFQEGCCGLIHAARSFDPVRGIPFPAYALPRIHTAVSTALHGNASLVKVPRRRRARKSGNHANSEAAPEVPRVYAFEDNPADGRPRGPEPTAGQNTIGERLRDKYDVAVDVASRSAGWRKSRRADRQELVGRLVEHRFRVAEPEAKTALREIARETGSSYSRVLQCERRLKQGVRRALAGDRDHG